MARLSPFHEEALNRTALVLGSDGVVQRIRAPKTAEMVAQELRRQIVRGAIDENEALPPENTLMEAFGVSRPTLREAYRVLEAENLITVRRGAHGGARVHAPSGNVAARYVSLVLEHRGATLEDVVVAREMIELDAVRTLVPRVTKADVAALRRRQEELGALDPPRRVGVWARNSLTFHELMVELARNSTLAVFEQMVNFIIVSAQESYAGTQPAGIGPDSARSHVEHGEMIDAIQSRDVEAALDLWRGHLQHFGPSLIDVSRSLSLLDLVSGR